MREFEDAKKRKWQISVNVFAVQKARASLSVDLPGLLSGRFDAMLEFLADPVMLFETLYLLCEEQAEEDGVSKKEFGLALHGDALDRAQNAFVLGVVDFFGDPEHRKALRTVWEKMRACGRMVGEREVARLQAIDPEAEALKLIEKSGGSPASAESTPDPSPSAS